MMEKPEDFRRLALYYRSLDLHKAVNNLLRVHGARLNEVDQLNLRKRATVVTKKIAYAMSQTNNKIRFKKLNEAKNCLLQLKSMLKEAVSKMDGAMEEYSKVEDYIIQVLKLFNYSFAQLKKQRIK
ncbi:hypothetical protein V7124_19785 [Neobacillus niacini]|uniref:hypothetical protein n=1 Tax=Neobacillus niacini TaxID=86668 RepID=UPI003000C00E